MNLLKSLSFVLLSVSAHVGYAAQCTLVEDRWSISDETLSIGDTVTVSVGGYSVSYTTNQYSTAPGDWQKYLALEFNSQVPASFARMGDVDNGYQPSFTEENLIDVFAAGIPVSITTTSTTQPNLSVAAESVPPVSSSGSIGSPMFIVTNSAWAGSFNLTNVSDVPVTVTHTLTDASGSPFTPSKLTHYEAYTTSNSPFASNGAVLQPGEMGPVSVCTPNETSDILAVDLATGKGDEAGVAKAESDVAAEQDPNRATVSVLIASESGETTRK